MRLLIASLLTLVCGSGLCIALLRSDADPDFVRRLPSPDSRAATAAQAPSDSPHALTIELQQQVDGAIERATAYLIAQQLADGTWRSQTYGSLRDDLALTATIGKALMYGIRTPDSAAALERARGALRMWIESPRESTLRLDYPVYTAALAAMVLHASADESDRAAAGKWLDLLRSHQLNEDFGWTPEDVSYGGWGYSVLPPRKPEKINDRLPFESDLSSTLFALGALFLCSENPELDESINRARSFVLRCQNYADQIHSGNVQFEDGGFFFAPASAIQNKAGSSGTDAQGRVRFHSYGTATADGARALLMLGFDRQHSRVQTAQQWLIRNFSAKQVPGEFEPSLEPDRNAAYFYHCWSVTHALRRLQVDSVSDGDAGSRDWASDMARALVRAQRDDGRWQNAATLMKEDDPLVATPLALGALVNCRIAMYGAFGARD